jgi:GAF domain-containing protein
MGRAAMTTRRSKTPKQRGSATGAATGQRSALAELRKQLDRQRRELAKTRKLLKSALEQQLATSEVLQVINSSPAEVAPVFDAMLKRAMQLCEAAFGGLWVFEGSRYVAKALCGVPEAYASYLRHTSLVPGPHTAPYRFLNGERSAIQNIDLAAEEPYLTGDPQRRALVDLGGARAALQVPLVRNEVVLGVITIYRQQVRPFSEQHVRLLHSFADQAVVAIGNARLFNDTREALEQQRATSEVLQVINSSPGDLAPVFDAMLDKALQLCEASFGNLITFDGQCFNFGAGRGLPEFNKWAHEVGPLRPSSGTTMARMVQGERLIHIADLADDAAYRASNPVCRALVEIGGLRTFLGIALWKDDTLLGALQIYRQEVRPFSDKQIALLQNVAAQAVIAMANARRYRRGRTERLTQRPSCAPAGRSLE